MKMLCSLVELTIKRSASSRCDNAARAVVHDTCLPISQMVMLDTVGGKAAPGGPYLSKPDFDTELDRIRTSYQQLDAIKNVLEDLVRNGPSG